MSESVTTSSQKSLQSVLICFSHLRWNFVFQRPQHLMIRAAQEHKVFFFEEPMFEDVDEHRQDLHQDSTGVVIAGPILPAGLGASELASAQRGLLDGLVQEFPSDPPTAPYYASRAM